MKRPFITMFMLLVSIAIMAQSRCSYCGGKGTVVKNITSSQYGLNGNYKVKCPTCGEYHLKSIGHTHITCSKCGGSGLRGSSSSSSSSSSSYVDEDAYYSNPEIRYVALNTLYGLPYTEQEAKAVSRLDRANAAKYLEWRRLLDGFTIGYRKSVACEQVPQDKAFKDRMKQTDAEALSEAASKFTVTPELKVIADGLVQQYEQAFQQFRNYTSLNDITRDIEILLLEQQLSKPLW